MFTEICSAAVELRETGRGYEVELREIDKTAHAWEVAGDGRAIRATFWTADRATAIRAYKYMVREAGKVMSRR